MHIVLLAPQIAPNTGNIIRLCANVGASLHLVEPLGFSMDDRLLRRGGLDYHELADVHVHASLDDVRAHLAAEGANPRWFALTGRGGVRYDTVTYQPDDVLLFGCEATGLPDAVIDSFEPDARLAISMRPGNRSLNLGNAVAVVAYEAWRQLGFADAAPLGGQAASTIEALSLDPPR